VMPRPFCRATTTVHGVEVTCHRMRGHAGAHIERHGQVGDYREDYAWLTVAEPSVRLSLVPAEPRTPVASCGDTRESAERHTAPKAKESK
jgi:hypothetical protein